MQWTAPQPQPDTRLLLAPREPTCDTRGSWNLAAAAACAHVPERVPLYFPGGSAQNVLQASVQQSTNSPSCAAETLPHSQSPACTGVACLYRACAHHTQNLLISQSRPITARRTLCPLILSMLDTERIRDGWWSKTAEISSSLLFTPTLYPHCVM